MIVFIFEFSAAARTGGADGKKSTVRAPITGIDGFNVRYSFFLLSTPTDKYR